MRNVDGIFMQVTSTSLALIRPRNNNRQQTKKTGEFKPFFESFETALAASSDYIEADFQEISDDFEKAASDDSVPGYQHTLFPAFLFKSRYVNYYI